ncbi:PAS domain-containing protein [Qiania dongpingensis]|uniref:Stage 0 sporulation protein A homolog n=1 Tax=Qiania dongpingensis TaxID=2763669 RepID=A0A7G9G2Q1_9FIRM|nr:PAS domain-containing protein [Qiania dongpingensis]QNM05083.1 PAS domain-containing protein [Qiania dongpingensis]
MDVRTEVIQFARKMMRLHYCENDVEGVIGMFAPDIVWIGAGEGQQASGFEAVSGFFRRFKNEIPECRIWDDQYEVQKAAEDLYICTGIMWVATVPRTKMYLKVHQRVTFAVKKLDGEWKCSYLHCSNPYQEMVEDELFPEKIGQHTYEYIQERLNALETEKVRKAQQLDVIMSSISGGLKMSLDDELYTYAFVSEEAAGLFGYTVEEFLEVTGGNAFGAVYPPDVPRVTQECVEAFQDGKSSYAIKYRVRCKDGGVKWILDSGKKVKNDDGTVVINSLYLDVSKAEEDERRIREQKELLDSIYDTIPCGIFRFLHGREEHEIVAMNRAALNILDYESVEECVADSFRGVASHVVPEDHQNLYEVYDKICRDGGQAEVEYRVLRKRGEIRWVSSTNMMVEKRNGIPVIQRTLVDITERKRLQEQLDREQEMYRAAMESSSDTIYEYRVDEDLLVAYVASREQEKGENILRLEVPGFREQLYLGKFAYADDIPFVMETICCGKTPEAEARVYDYRGGEKKLRWNRVTGRMIRHEGKPARVVGTLRDIHEMKQSMSEKTEELRVSQMTLQVVSNVYVSIFYVDLLQDSYYGVRIPEGADTMAVPKRGRYSEIMSGYIKDFVVPEEQERMKQFTAAAASGEGFRNGKDHMEIEFRQKRAEGKPPVWLRMEINLAADIGGRPGYMVITFINISGEKCRELEKLLEEQKAKEALTQAYEAANKANEAKSTFLSRMSHDIRTPMNAIIGMTSIAGAHLGEPDKIEDCLDKIKVSSRHLLTLINEVLDMSKIESGRASLKESAFSILDMVEEVEVMMKPEIEKKSQVFQMSMRDIVHDCVLGDMARLQQVFINLLSNAVKYTQERGTISFRALEKPSNMAGVGCYEFLVEDNGIGMSEEFLKKIFEPFERAEDSRVSKAQGTGLGTSIALNIVQMMNGTIDVSSELGKGSLFRVTVYLKIWTKNENWEYKEAFEERQGGSFCLLENRTVLLAEDNELNQEIAGELLSMCGVRVETADNGKEALEKFSASETGYYSVIFMDIQMPVMDGYEAARKIRGLSRPDAESVPIIALTANAFSDDISRSEQAGMNEHVAKPLDIERLKKVLLRWVR